MISNLFSTYPYEAALIILCPVGAILGSFAHAIVHTIDVSGPPNHESEMGIASKNLQKIRGTWLGLRMMLGAILGLVIGLYFIGAIQENMTTISKIIAFSILAGYSAPKIWDTQEKIVEQKIKKIFSNEFNQQTVDVSKKNS